MECDDGQNKSQSDNKIHSHPEYEGTEQKERLARSASLVYHRRQQAHAPLNLKARKTAKLKLYRSSSISSESSTSQAAAGQMQYAMHQLGQLEQMYEIAPSLGSSQTFQHHYHLPHTAPSPTPSGQQQQQQQHRLLSRDFLSKPLNRPPATLSVMANLSNSLLNLAAEKASPAAAANLKEQLLQDIRVAAAAAAEAGQPFEVAVAMEQLLPALQEAVLHECRQAQRQREAAAAATAAAVAAARATAAATREASKQQQQQQRQAAAAAALQCLAANFTAAEQQGPAQWSSYVAATAVPHPAAMPTKGSGNGDLLASTLAEPTAAAAAAAAVATPGFSPDGHMANTWAAPPLAGSAETGTVHGEAPMTLWREWHPEQCSATAQQQQQQHWTELQYEKADSCGSDGTRGWGSAPSNATPSEATGAAAAAAATAAAGVHETSDASQQLQLLMSAIGMLQQHEGAYRV